jgi:hypothetical protein
MKFEGGLFCEEAEEERVKMSPACQTGPRTRGPRPGPARALLPRISHVFNPASALPVRRFRREGHGASEAAAKAEACSAAISCRTGLSSALESISCVKTSCERCVRERGPLPD